jgi:hypothetical protein
MSDFELKGKLMKLLIYFVPLLFTCFIAIEIEKLGTVVVVVNFGN